MLYLNEYLPNPAGDDAKGEWVEVWNSGPAAVSLSGWRLGAGSGKPKALPAKTVPAGGYAVLRRAETKLSIKNADGEIVLYDPAGRPAGRLSFRGQAQEGKSVNRDAQSGLPGGTSAQSGLPGEASAKSGYFSDPTPGAANAPRKLLANMEDSYPRGMPVRGPDAGGSMVEMWLGSSLLIALAAAMVVQYAGEQDSDKIIA